MQRRTPDNLVIISCDFCGDDWDEVKPMIEGHHGSIICLECLKAALEEADENASRFECTMCLRDLGAEMKRYRPSRSADAALPQGANPHAAICIDCINQAAGTFSKDPDVDWKRY